MAGWVKLWRQLKDNGHLKMPGAAFKLWIFCLLEAAPYPDQERDLKVGELWLSYEGIQQSISEEGRKISMSTVSSALKHLEQNGYIALQPIKFKGIKARIKNWSEYQATTLTVAGDNLPTTPRVAGENPVNTQFLDTTTTPTVAAGDPPGYPHSSRVATPTVAVKAPEPNSEAASGTPKNNNKNTAVVVVDLVGNFEKEFGRELSPLELNQLSKWRKEYPEELIMEALVRAVMQNKRSLAYIGGILTNWQRSGICTVDDARQEKQPGRSRRGNVQPGKQEPANRKKKDFIRSLYI